MKISTSQIYDNLIQGVRKQMTLQADGNAQIASGTRFQTPAQAGLDYKTSLDIRHAQSSVQGGLDAIGVAQSRLGVSQTLLNDMSNILKRAQTLAVQQASAQIGAPERQTAAIEVGHLLDQMLGDANQQWQGQTLFGGTAVDRPAFVTDAFGAIVYNGSAQDRLVTISASQQVTSNIRGDDPAFAPAFTALQDLQTALQNNDVAGIQTALGNLNSAGNGMVDLTSVAGSRLNALQTYQNSYNDMKTQLDTQLNLHEGVDIPAIMTRLQQSSIALQAAYGQINNMQALSLTNYLK